VASLEFCGNVGETEAAQIQQHQKVIDQIGSLGSQSHVIFGDSRHNGLNRFLAEFLGDLEPPAGSKLGRVTPRLRVTQAVLDDGFKRRQKI
jgi:hypothetical protein